MKLKKIISCVMAIATLGAVSVTPMVANALYTPIDGSTMDKDSLEYYQKNSIKNVIFNVEDGEYSNTYYLVYDKNTLPSKLVDENVDLSSFETITVTPENNTFIFELSSTYQVTIYDFNQHIWCSTTSSISKDTTVGDSSSTIGDSSTVGDSDVLPSEPTGIRGDVNYDGKVNVADIITLRRYLLHIIEC